MSFLTALSDDLENDFVKDLRDRGMLNEGTLVEIRRGKIRTASGNFTVILYCLHYCKIAEISARLSILLMIAVGASVSYILDVCLRVSGSASLSYSLFWGAWYGCVIRCVSLGTADTKYWIGDLQAGDDLLLFLDKFKLAKSYGAGLDGKIADFFLKVFTLGRKGFKFRSWKIEWGIFCGAWDLYRKDPQMFKEMIDKARNKKEFLMLLGVN